MQYLIINLLMHFSSFFINSRYFVNEETHGEDKVSLQAFPKFIKLFG